MRKPFLLFMYSIEGVFPSNKMWLPSSINITISDRVTKTSWASKKSSVGRRFELFFTHLILFNESNESSAFNFDRLTGTIVQRYNEVEEVALAQVAGRLLFEVRATDTYAAK